MKIYSVQYLRAVAAISVMIAHSILYPLKVPSMDAARLGSFGVLLFFVISGFIMVFISGEATFSPLKFVERRLLRIVPLYWIATIAVGLVAAVAPHAMKTSVFTLPHLILSLLFIPHFAPQGGLAPILKLGWTLNLEMFFYACFAVLAGFNATVRVAVLTLFFALLVVLGDIVPFHSAIALAYTHYFILAFCVGTWIGLAALKGWSLGNSPSLAIAVAVAGVALLVAGFALQHGTRGAELVTACLTLAAAALLLLGLGFETSMPALRLPTLLGDASYSIYLVHMYFVAIAVAAARHLFHDLSQVPLSLFIVAVAASAGVSVHLLVEKPLLRLTRLPKRRPAVAQHPAMPIPTDGVSPALVGNEAGAAE